MSELVYLSNVRLSFPHLAEPQKTTGENGVERVSYNAEFILGPNDPAFQKFMQVVGQMAIEKWKDQATAVINHVNQDRKKRCYGWGQEKVNQKTFKIYDGYEGNVFITAGRNQMPQIIDPQGKPVDPANTMQCQALARAMYGGCRVNAAVKPWLQENKHGRGIRADLVAVQFLADDAPFGEGMIDASGIFGAVAPPPVAGFPPVAPGAAPAAPGWAAPATQMPGVPFPGAQPPQAPAAPAWAPPAAPTTNPPWM